MPKLTEGELSDDDRLYNSAALVDGSGTRALYRKAHLWDTEKLIFTPGDATPPVTDLGFGRVGLMICHDLEFQEWARLAALGRADIIAAPVNWPATGPSGRRTGLAATRTEPGNMSIFSAAPL
jgi:predicted amidohydrolase